MDELISIKDKSNSEDVKLNISNVSWKISDELQDKSYDELRLDSIMWIQSYANDLSSKLSKICEVKVINVNESNNTPIMYARNEMAYSSMSKSAADVAPISSEQNITVNPNFILECK